MNAIKLTDWEFCAAISHGTWQIEKPNHSYTSASESKDERCTRKIFPYKHGDKIYAGNMG